MRCVQLLILFFITFNLSPSIAENLPSNEKVYEEGGIFYKVNRFGDIFPIWQNIPEKDLTEKLLGFIEAVKEKKSPIILEIPHETSPILDAIIKSNFIFHYADQ